MEEFSAISYTEEISSPRMLLAEDNPKKRAGRKKFKETRHPVFRGIRHRDPDKWVCETREPNKKTRIWLGTFPTAEMAARAHDVASIALRGPSACLNFANSAWLLPIPASPGHTKDIQRAAAEAAELFRPQSTVEADEGEESWTEEELFGRSDIILAEVYNGMLLLPTPDYADMVDDYLLEEGKMGWMDEDDIGMPEILADMYNGMMLTSPPPHYANVADDYDDYDAGFPLWTSLKHTTQIYPSYNSSEEPFDDPVFLAQILVELLYYRTPLCHFLPLHIQGTSESQNG